MAGKKKTNFSEGFTKINGKDVKFVEVDLTTGETTFFLPLDIVDKNEKKMMDNVGRNMSRYIENHPESALWGKT